MRRRPLIGPSKNLGRSSGKDHAEAAQEGRHDPRRACGRGGLSVFTVRAYEQGKRMPDDEQRFAMVRAFGVPEEVLTGYDIRNANEGLTTC